MSKIALEIKDFSHVKSDEHSTTLRHKQGHLLKIAHKALSPKFQEQLKSLANVSKNDETPLQSAEMNNQAPMAKGGDVKITNDTGYKGIESKDKHVQGETIDYKNFPKETNKKNREQQIEDRKKKSHKDQFPHNKPQATNMMPGNAPGDDVQAFAQGTPDTPIQSQDDQDSSQAPNNSNQNIPMSSQDPSLLAALNPSSYQPDSQSPQSQSAPSQAPARNAYQSALLEKYNQLAQEGSKLGTGLAADPINPNTDKVPSINPDTMSAAKKALDQQNQTQFNTSAQAAQMATSQNAARQAIGLPPIPMPTVSSPDLGAQAQNIGQSNPEDSQNSEQDSQNPIFDQNSDSTNTDVQNMINAPMQMAQKGYQNTIQGYAGEAEARGALGQQQAGVEAQQAQDLQTYQQHFLNNYNQIFGEANNFAQDIKNGYINPEQYWSGYKDPKTGQTVDAHSRIATAIGLIVSGIGGPQALNAALSNLHYQMTQSFESQKEHYQQENNAFSHLIAEGHNTVEAGQMMQAFNNIMTSHMLNEAADKAQSPIQKAIAQQEAGKFQWAGTALLQNLTAQKTAYSIANDPKASDSTLNKAANVLTVMGNPEGKVIEQGHIPGYLGVSSNPIPPPVMQQLIDADQLDRQAHYMLQWAQQHREVSDWSPQDYQTAKVISQELQSTIRKNNLGGVWKQSEVPLLNALSSNNIAGVFSKITSDPKIKEAIRYNRMQQQILARHYNIKPKWEALNPELDYSNNSNSSPQTENQAQQNQDAAMSWLKANPNDPRAAQIKKILSQGK